VLDVHPATTTVKDRSAITKPAMKTRLFSIISLLRCLLYMLMGGEARCICVYHFHRRGRKMSPLYRLYRCAILASDDEATGTAKRTAL
jgi:hypothetical protein